MRTHSEQFFRNYTAIPPIQAHRKTPDPLFLAWTLIARRCSPQANARTILRRANEFDASGFEGFLDVNQSGRTATWYAVLLLETLDGSRR
jgi:hypothetical protein